MKAYRVAGTFLMKDRWQDFKKEVAAENPAQAKEAVLSDLGSKHRAPRKFIKIAKIEEIRADGVQSPVVRWKIGGEK